MRMLEGIPREYFYHMKGQIRKEVLQSKHLSISLSRGQARRSHMDSVIMKANQKLRFVRCNLRGAPLCAKITAYFTIMWAGMEYAVPIWDPCFCKDMDTLEMVERKAAGRFKVTVFLQCQHNWTPDWVEMGPLADHRDVSLSFVSYTRYTGGSGFQI